MRPMSIMAIHKYQIMWTAHTMTFATQNRFYSSHILGWALIVQRHIVLRHIASRQTLKRHIHITDTPKVPFKYNQQFRFWSFSPFFLISNGSLRLGQVRQWGLRGQVFFYHLMYTWVLRSGMNRRRVSGIFFLLTIPPGKPHACSQLFVLFF